MKYEKACGAVIVNDNKVLLIRQTEGHLSFPKGHVEELETEVATALREVKEETNLDIKIDINKRFVNRYTIDNKIDKEVILFVAKPLTLDIQVQEEEVSEYLWIDKDKVIDYFEFENQKKLWLEIIDFI